MKTKNNLYTIIASTILGGTIFYSCSKAPTTNENEYGNFDTKSMLNNIVSNVIDPAATTYKSKVDSLAILTNTFVQNPNATNLSLLQQVWIRASLSWANLAPFNFGPLNNTIENQIDYWPVNTTLIDADIVKNATASEQGANATGLKAIEYLIFDTTGSDIVVKKYTTDLNTTNQINYLKGCVSFLQSVSTSLVAKYDGSYTTSFVNAYGNDVTSSISLMINALSIYLDVVKNMKIGNPIGQGVKINDSQLHPEQIEAPLSKLSTSIILNNISTMKNIFVGGTGQGLDDLLDSKNVMSGSSKLSVVVSQNFDEILQTLTQINQPMNSAIYTQKTQIQDAYTQIKSLLKYMKVDVANNLGISITFTDTDGD